MSIKKYEVLLKAIDTGSFSKAGELLGYTQSGITHMMNSLEEEFGFKILKRSKTGVTLTKEGELIVPTIREILRLEETLQQTAAQINGIEKGTLAIGTLTSLLLNWVPDIIEIFQEEHPNIEIQVMEGKIKELEKWLEDGTIDVCFFSHQSYHTYEYIDLENDPLLAILPEGHMLTGMSSVPVEEFSKQPFLLNDADLDVKSFLYECSIYPKIVFSSNFHTAVIAMAEHNYGISILPKILCDTNQYNVVTKELNPPAARKIIMAYLPGSEASPVIKNFIKCVKKYFRKK